MALYRSMANMSDIDASLKALLKRKMGPNLRSHQIF